jgi:hypothetical protein
MIWNYLERIVISKDPNLKAFFGVYYAMKAMR